MVDTRFVAAHLRFVALTLPLAVLAASCGAPQFMREPGAPKYKALHYTHPVMVAPRLDMLPEPRQIVGLMATLTRGGAGDRAKVAGKFRSEARKYGCDAVAEVSFETLEKKGTRPVRVLGKDGRPETVQEAFVVRDYRWTGKCVRTADVGLDPGAAPTARVATDDAAVKELLASATNEPVDPVPAPPAGGAGPKEATVAATHPIVADFAQRLDRYADTYLRNWREKLRAPGLDAMDVLEAWNELAFQVSGPGGFWRRTVPQNWWGCAGSVPAETCKNMEAATRDLARWDRMQAAIGAIEPQQALSFLRKQKPKLAEYLDAVVPDEANQSSMEHTGFFKAHFQASP
ncbi:MAG: hypothetical protein EXR79_07325 [Myxococcales bacterium]|nr:hypothetical protein [Myxococcales bacterium]